MSFINTNAQLFICNNHISYIHVEIHVHYSIKIFDCHLSDESILNTMYSIKGWYIVVSVHSTSPLGVTLKI